MLSEEQAGQIKEQLLSQIDSFPEDKRENARENIEAMNPEQLEDFLIKNNLIKNNECIFCSIVSGETPSYKIGENSGSIAILDINPVSEGHSLVIPKEHKPVEESRSSLELAQKTASIIKKQLNPSEIKVESSNAGGHGLINLIPIYKGKKLEKKKASEEELLSLQKKLEEKEEAKEEKKTEKQPAREIRVQDLEKAPRRIP